MSGTRSRRSLTALAAVAVVLIALSGLDRLASFTAGRALAGRIQVSQRLQARPKVTVGGFPFLTQVLRGQYREVTISTAGPELLRGVQVRRAAVRLRGVTIADVFRGTIRDLPVTSGTATALIGYPQLSQLLAGQLGVPGGSFTISGTSPGHARLTGPFGLSFGFAAAVRGGALTVAPDLGSLQALPGPVRNVVTGALSAPVALPSLPFNAMLNMGTLTSEGLLLTAVARNTVIPLR